MSAFRHTLRVRFQECDPQGVVYFARYLDYLDIAMTELWREHIGPYGDMVAAGTDMVVAEAQIRYAGSATFDDLVDVEIGVEHLGTTSLVVGCRVLRGDEVLATGTLRQVFIDPSAKAKKEIPPDVRAALERLAARSTLAAAEAEGQPR